MEELTTEIIKLMKDLEEKREELKTILGDFSNIPEGLLVQGYPIELLLPKITAHRAHKEFMNLLHEQSV